MRHPCYQRASACLSVSGMVWKGRNHVAGSCGSRWGKIPRGTNQTASHWVEWERAMLAGRWNLELWTWKFLIAIKLTNLIWISVAAQWYGTLIDIKMALGSGLFSNLSGVSLNTSHRDVPKVFPWLSNTYIFHYIFLKLGFLLSFSRTCETTKRLSTSFLHNTFTDRLAALLRIVNCMLCKELGR